jgi:hypothetical protein
LSITSSNSECGPPNLHDKIIAARLWRLRKAEVDQAKQQPLVNEALRSSERREDPLSLPTPIGTFCTERSQNSCSPSFLRLAELLDDKLHCNLLTGRHQSTASFKPPAPVLGRGILLSKSCTGTTSSGNLRSALSPVPRTAWPPGRAAFCSPGTRAGSRTRG